MKERPILFSCEMVRAILEGRKTMTRRILKQKAVDWLPTLSDISIACKPSTGLCHIGYPGDRLWVRETWNKFGDYHAYRATDEDVYPEKKWRSPIFMPRVASRILLEITDVRVERLKEITAADCVCEGIEFESDVFTTYNKFRRLWKSINGPESWGRNPWIWVITFKHITP